MIRAPLSTLMAALAALLIALPAAALLGAGDQAYRARAVDMNGRLALPDSIDRSIASYESLLRSEPDRIDVQWRLLRSLYYRGDFAVVSEAAKREAFERGRALSEEQLARLEVRTGEKIHALEPAQARRALREAGISESDVARFYFWASVHWGAWSRDVGLLTVVREGVANHVFEYARISAVLEPGYERGGAHRMLSRLHATLPRVPFISGWVDRDRAIPEVEAALAQAPGDPGNRFLLAITLLELVPGRADEARAILAEVAGSEPRPDQRAEDLAVIVSSRERLEEIESD